MCNSKHFTHSALYFLVSLRKYGSLMSIKSWFHMRIIRCGGWNVPFGLNLTHIGTKWDTLTCVIYSVNLRPNGKLLCVTPLYNKLFWVQKYYFWRPHAACRMFLWLGPSFLKNPRTLKNICLKHKKETEREIVKTVWTFDEKVQDMDMRIYF